jgi:RimJ/RimL family protein N-acetyltransferase
VKLIPVDPYDRRHCHALYELLAERTPAQSISHKELPTWEDHVAFVQRMGQRGAHPDEECYEAWYLVELGSFIIGSVYLTDRSEIGVSIFYEKQRDGYGLEAVKLLMEKHGHRRYLANVAPTNEPSRKMFEKLGFKLVQHTFALEAE